MHKKNPNALHGIHCDAKNCIYNAENCACTANEISVGTKNACSVNETLCGTFKLSNMAE